MSLSRPRDWKEDHDGRGEGSDRSPASKRSRRCCSCCRDTRDFYKRQMELLKEIGCMRREIGSIRDFIRDFCERQMELFKEMRCMPQGLESIRRELPHFNQTIYPNFSEMTGHNQRKQHDSVALMAEISRSGGYIQQSPGPRMSSDEDCIKAFRLQFENSCRLTKYSNYEIKADDGTPLTVAIYDCNNRIVTREPFSSMRVHIVAVHGDFDNEQKGHWTEEELHSKIVLGRPKHKQLLLGTLFFRLQNGVGYLNDAKFQDSCCFVPSKTLKLAVMADDERIMERIQEGITDSFRVLDGRGFPSRKNPYPSPRDPVHKLNLIAKDGDRHKSLESNGIMTVEDFLLAYSKDEKKLRKILGKISDHDWNIIVEHAHKCKPRKEIYSHHIEERNVSDEHETISRNSNSFYLRGSCSVQPSDTVQASFHERSNVQVMHQQVSSTYDGQSSGVPLENVPSELSLEPNTSCQHVMPHEHFGVIQVNNQQISSTGNGFLSVMSMANTLESSISLQPDSLQCNKVDDGNKLIPSSSAENILDGSTSLQTNPPKHSTTSNDGPHHNPRATGSHPLHRRLKIATTVAAAVIIWKKVAESPRLTIPVYSGITQSPLSDYPESWSPSMLLEWLTQVSP